MSLPVLAISYAKKSPSSSSKTTTPASQFRPQLSVIDEVSYGSITHILSPLFVGMKPQLYGVRVLVLNSEELVVTSNASETSKSQVMDGSESSSWIFQFLLVTSLYLMVSQSAPSSSIPL